MASLEATPIFSGREKPSKPSKLEKLGQKIVLAAALAAPMAANAEGTKTPSETARAEQAVPGQEKIENDLAKAQKFLLVKVDGLSLFTGPVFVEEVKKNAGSIRSFLDNPESLPMCDGLLGEILKQYAKPLALAKRDSPELYRKKTDQFRQAIAVIETESLTKIKRRLTAIF